MLKDEFRERYTTVPFAIYKAYYTEGMEEVITHYHQEVELIALTGGAAEFYINSKRYYAKKGDVLIIPPYALHRIRMTENTVTSYDCICFDLKLLCDEQLKEGLESQALSVVPLITAEDAYSKNLQEYIKNSVIACENAENGWELEAVGNMSLLFGALRKNKYVLQKFEINKDSEFVRRTMNFLQENISFPITSRDAANELYMNHSYFCRLFKKTFGFPFANYALMYRLEKARIYLTSSAMSVVDIAYRLGFNSCSYFGKTFKERFRMSPLSYRKSKTAKYS